MFNNFDVDDWKGFIKRHDYDVDRLSNMMLLQETTRIAYLLGIVRGSKKKHQLWEEIVRKLKEEGL